MRTNLKTYNLAVEFFRLTRELKLPRYLREQLDRAASSTVLNLAEGAGRTSPRDQRRFYSIALGSHRECQAILDLAQSENPKLGELADSLGAHTYRLILSCGG